MQRNPNDSLEPNASSSRAGERSSQTRSSASSSGSTSPRFPITRLEATDRAEWQSKTIGRSSDIRPPSDQQAQPTDSPSSSTPSTPTTATPSSRTYHSLNYAPRQRNSMLRPNAASIFQSHSSQFSQGQQLSSTATSGAASPSGRVSPSPSATTRIASHSSPLTATSYLTTSPSYPTISLPDALPPRSGPRGPATGTSEADTARAARARIQLHQMQDEARRLGLNEKSAGWLILEALQAATEGEWAAVAELLANGDATLLLPRDPPSVFTSASQLSASFAYDHTIFNASSASAAKPTPSVLSESLPILTLSGLRGTLSRTPYHDKAPDTSEQATPPESYELTLQTFVVKTSQSSISDLKDASSRQETLETLAPLPNVTAPDDPRCRHPTFALSASNAQFPLPPPLNPRATSAEDQAAGKSRTRSNSKLNAAGSRASASFASIFGGSGRERRRHVSATAETAGSEMIDAQRLSVTGVHSDAGVSQEGSEADRSVQTSSGLGAELRDDAKEQSNEDAATAQDSSDVSATGAESSRRTVSVWVVDHLVRRSAVMRTIRKTLDARIKKRLSTAGIPESICEVVASFAATYLPPVPSLSDTATARSGLDTSRSRASSPVNIANPPYLAEPDDMSDNVQDFFNSIRDQLYKLDSLDNKPSQKGQDDAVSTSASLDVQRDQHDRIERQLETVESVLCEEVYDRLFCPATSRDRYHDDALASRIAALNVLGLSLRHLGLDVPAERMQGDAEEAEKSNALLDGLDRIVQQCGAELQRLESATCRSPQAKLEVLVRAHKIAVQGAAELPSIKMRDDDADADDNATDATPATTKKAGESTSADLILPILIYSIVASNPSRLASNLLYIERFRAESLVQGETSYCLVNVQAAVAFLENVDVKDLGLDSSQIGAHLRVAGADGEQAPRPSAGGPSVHDNRAAATATLAMPARIRGRLTQEIGDLAGASNKVITGVMGSSISAFSRMMGASANGDAGAAEAMGRKRTKSSASLNVSVPSDTAASPVGASARPLRSRTSSSVTPTDYSRSEEQSREKDISGTPTGSGAAAADKPTIGDRLAMLGRLGASALSSSPSSSLGLGLPSAPAATGQDTAAGLTAVSTSAPSSIASPRAVSRELPGPPPPSKAAAASRPAAQGRTTSYLAAQLGRITTAARSTSSTSLAPSAMEDAAAAPTTTTTGAPASKPLPASLQSPYPALSRPPTAERPLHVVLASTGSVASVKMPLIVEELLKHANVRVQVIATDNSLHFYDRSVIAQLNQTYSPAGAAHDEYTVAALAAENLAASRSLPCTSVPRAHLWTNADEWHSFTRIGDAILHIELRRWADIVLVAPASANTLAKLSAGICDDLLTSFMRALGRDTPTVLFPAMNTLMWLHPLTEVHVGTVRDVLGYEVRGPVEKRLACGDVGKGAMTEWTDVVGVVVGRFGLVREEKGEKV
ncbi:related to Phosphopantothenoylcysteine decarboxylase [Sporisorium reilianum SRZ2]|uniref:Related to Phosphopantothenoylcysteine decarboxylase n=1 Tax=Sporisorium reilianum (strain SRZ2) TaxID=999809 RepID=E6ZUQ2_SPORE|nr:related to Phosphopantothenoylcysteine decarboxylase [Sporisorium reilianum SRZ2]